MDLFEKFSFKKNKGSATKQNPSSQNSMEEEKDKVIISTKLQSRTTTQMQIEHQDSSQSKSSIVEKKEDKKNFGKRKTLKMLRSESNDMVIKLEKMIIGGGQIPVKQLMITSWNVAGLRRALNNGCVQDYILKYNPDILCLCETKIDEETSKTDELLSWIPDEYQVYYNCCKIRKGYSGTAIITRFPPLSVTYGIGKSKHDNEGRAITIEYDNFYLINAYVPNASEGLKNLDYRIQEWDVDFREYLTELKKLKPVFLCGDLNVAHEEIDIYEPKGHEKTPCFTPQERKNFTTLLKTGFKDTFRYLYPYQKKFSFFSYRFDSKTGYRGWRLDYFLTDERVINAVLDCVIQDTIDGSDHHPVELIFNTNFVL